MRFLLLLVLVPGALAACGEEQGEDPVADPAVTDASAAVKLVERSEADLLLYVEGQHNWISFPLSVPSGTHEITATSDSGAELRESFEVPRSATRYAVIDHWTADGSADLTWQFSRDPVAFG